MAYLEKVIKVTKSQYDTLASGGTVGSYTGLDSDYVYFVEDTNTYITSEGGTVEYLSINNGVLEIIGSNTSYSGDDYETVYYSDAISYIGNETGKEGILLFPDLNGQEGTIAVTDDIPVVNNATLTIQKNGTTVNTFSANASSNVTANITVPTKTSDLTNDSGFLTSESDTLATVTGRGNTTTSAISTSSSVTASTGFKSDTTAAAMWIGQNNEIDLGSNGNTFYIGYQNRLQSSGVVTNYKFGNHSGSTGASSGIIECGKVIVPKLNNGADITIPNTSGTMALTSDISSAINALDANSVGSNGSYLKTISEANGIISATPQAFDTQIDNSSTNNNAPTSLAVKSFVNSSVATNTAYFLGTFDIVSDLGLTTSATESQIATAIATELASESVTPTNNDYVFVAYPDATDATQYTKYDRYKYDGSAWAYEYTLNNSSFTAAQWAAINSGITSTTVGKLVLTEGAQDVGGEKTFTSNVNLKSNTDDSPYIVFKNQNGSKGIKMSGTILYSDATIAPMSGATADLGTTSQKWQNLYLSGNLSDGTNSVSIAQIGKVKTINSTSPDANGNVSLTIPNPTDYYWANVKISSSSSNATKPIFSTTCLGYMTDGGANTNAYVEIGGLSQTTDVAYLKSSSKTGTGRALCINPNVTSGLATSTGPVIIGGSIPQTPDTTYKLQVTGKANIDTIYENGTALSSKYYAASNPNGYTSNTGTITGVSLNGTTVATSGVVALTNIATTSDLSGKLDKTTYEWNKEISFSSSGYLKIGSFPMYDSNITIDIDSTTSITYHGTVVIATQNVSTSSIGSAHVVSVYGDPSGSIASALRVVWTSGSRNYDVYFVPAPYSKNLIHIRAFGLPATPTDVCTSQTGTAPTTTSGLSPVNVLTSNFVTKTGSETISGTKTFSTNQIFNGSLTNTGSRSIDGLCGKTSSPTISSNTATLPYDTIAILNLDHDTTFNLTAVTGCTPEYRAVITCLDQTTITLPSGTTIKTNDKNISIANNVFVLPAQTTVELNIQNNKCILFNWGI